MGDLDNTWNIRAILVEQSLGGQAGHPGNLLPNWETSESSMAEARKTEMV